MQKPIKKTPAREIEARWIKVFNDRLTTDRIIATKIKRDRSCDMDRNAKKERNSSP